MTKNFKLVLALVLSLMMVLSSVAMAAVPTSQTIADGNAADANGKYQITVAESDPHTYKVYQILTGSLIAGETKLGNPVWGSDAAKTGDTDVKAFIESITASGLTNVQINDLVAAQLKTGATGVGTVTSAQGLDVVPGYYLIQDVTENLADSDSKSLNIVAVFNDIQIAAKKGTTTSEKHVDDVNDSDKTKVSNGKDSADYDVGDSIPYTLTFTLPEDYANYKKYYVSFVDDMSSALTYNGDAKIWYGEVTSEGTDIGSAFAASSDTSSYTTTPAAGTVYKYTIADLKTGTDAQKALTAGQTITIKYTATLNKTAVTGVAGNPNKYKVDYSSNPNQSGDGTPETNDTPWDTNIVFTYKTVFNKVDANQKPLTGADFTLYKFIADNNGTETYKEVKGSWVDVTTLGSGENKPSKTTEALTKGTDTAPNAKFTFSGIDDGWYKLVENQTPTGYNTLADQYFTVTAEHVLESDNPSLTSLTGTDDAQFTMTSNTNDGSLTADIENQQGAELPSTGGIGTTIFYVAGSIMVLAAAILLITKRRMGAND